MSTLEERIHEEIGDTPVEEVDELILDDFECTQLTALTDVYVNLEKLSAVSCGLTTLKGFPNLPNLKRLDLGSNKLTDVDLAYLAGCPALTQLMLYDNSIKDVSSLEPLKAHKSLRKLDLTGCGLCNADDYREKVFEMLDQLVYLDGMDKNDENDEDSDPDLDGDGDDDVDDENDDDDVGVHAEEDDDDEDEDEDEDDDDGEEAEPERGVKRKHVPEDDDDDDA